ncbi:outer membrane protein [Salibaculum halophilum]|uniref:outer membrane protein n=1 Tax=Salibaculum halophilum TaxID=1914408 RepID=UPI00117999FB|nr:outer membrane beta-barrel protein [Salibaculum halophilum]
MKQQIVLALAASLTASSALAGGMSEPVPEPDPVVIDPVDPAPAWTGFYAGGSLGYADATESTVYFADQLDGLTYGVHAGYDRDFGSAVLGGELELSGFDIEASADGVPFKIDSVLRAKLRAGYDAGNWLPYLTAGAARLTTSGLGYDSDTGSFYGVGVDYRLGNDMRVGAEVLDHQFDDFASSGDDFDVTTVSARVSFEF